MTAVLKEEFDRLVHGGADCDTEVDIKCNLGMSVYSAIYEDGHYANGFINIYRPWSVHIWWRLYGSLRDCICGQWCVSAHLESIGEGAEFNLKYDHIRFDCQDQYWHVRIPGSGISREHCASPYKIATTVAYKSLCDHPAPIVGQCCLPPVTFYYSER